MRWTRIILGTVAATLALTPAAHAATFTATGPFDAAGVVDRAVVDTADPEPPVITSPDADVVQTGNSVQLRGTASGPVDIFDNATLVKRVPFDGGTWVLDLSGLTEGEHVFTARTFDEAGNPSALSAQRKVTVDTVAPTVTITSIPPSLTTEFTFSVEFTASEPGVTSRCTHFWPDDPDHIDTSSCTSTSWTFRELPDGTHRFEITATDAAGNVGPTVAKEVKIDSVVPDPVEPSLVDATTFAFTAAEQGAAFECRLEGPAGDSGFQTCASPKAYPDLAPGDYRFTLRTLDAAGNHADANPRAFSVAPRRRRRRRSRPCRRHRLPGHAHVHACPDARNRRDRRRPSRQREDPRARARQRPVRRARRDKGPPGRHRDRRQERQDPAHLRARTGQAGAEVDLLRRHLHDRPGQRRLRRTQAQREAGALSERRRRPAPRPRSRRPASCGATARASSARAVSTARPRSAAPSGSSRTPARAR